MAVLTRKWWEISQNMEEYREFLCVSPLRTVFLVSCDLVKILYVVYRSYMRNECCRGHRTCDFVPLGPINSVKVLTFTA